MPFLYRILKGGTLSIPRLRHALDQIVMRHESLRTSLFFNVEENVLYQRILEWNDNDKNGLYTFIESIYTTEEDLNNIMHDERGNPFHFDHSRGLVFRCHIVHYMHISLDNLLHENDIIIFNFHHGFFDYPSMEIFHRDLDKAYTTGQLTINNNDLRYIDCQFIFVIVLTKTTIFLHFV